MFFDFFWFLTVLIKRIEKTKNRMKFDLEITIKVIDSKYIEIFPQLSQQIPNGKKWNLLPKKLDLLLSVLE